MTTSLDSIFQTAIETALRDSGDYVLVVAYSGGVDSHVLLHYLATHLHYKNNLRAIHINHQLSPHAFAWQKHCEEICQNLNVPLTTEIIQINNEKGESLEASAREARYLALRSLLQANDCLLTAHHADDQAETLLLQLLRGAGPLGLGAMKTLNKLDKQHFLIRPLLNITRQQILAYAEHYQLKWIEDESNQSIDFDRNYLRHHIFPLLQQRWPMAIKTITRSARLCAKSAQLLDELAALDYNEARGTSSAILSLEKLTALSRIRCHNLLRYWFKLLRFPLPNAKHLDEISDTLLSARDDATPLVCWKDVEIRRYRQYLYAERTMSAIAADWTAVWDIKQPLILPIANNQLIAHQVVGQGISAGFLASATVTVSFRKDGEMFHAEGRVGKHPLKKLFQEWGVPPWMRSRIPLIYKENELIAVVGYAIKAGCEAEVHELGWIFERQQTDVYD